MNFFQKKRSKRVASWIGGYLNNKERVVDIGAGDCILSHFLQEESGIEIFPVDVCDYSRNHLKTIVYDGKRLPFPNDYFDSALVLFVLHYVKDPLSLLREAQRVAKKRIIILQDICASPITLVPTVLWGSLANLGRHSDRIIPYVVTEIRLKNILDVLGLELIEERKFVAPISFYLINHQLIVAEKRELSAQTGNLLKISSDGYKTN